MMSADPDPSIDSIVFIFMYGRILAAKNILIFIELFKRREKETEG